MYLNELPVELNPGRLPLRPLGHAARFITQCDACGEFSLKRIVVACGHRFCASCCVSWVTPDGMQARCISCNATSLAVPGEELTEDFLRLSRFACSCGHEGTLLDIREHIKSDEVDHRPFDHSGLVREENTVNVLREEFRNLTTTLRTIKDRRKAYFCVELESKIASYKKKGEPQNTQEIPWVAAGYPARFSCQIATTDGRGYLGVYVHMLNEQPAFSGWPLKKKIIIEMYNLKGDMIRSYVLVTFDNEGPEDDKFTLACEPDVGRGNPTFYDIDELLELKRDILCKGTACFSVQFQDLHD